MTRYEKLKELIAADDFDMFALWVSITADLIKRACPAVCCSFRKECKSCPSGWRWALKKEIIIPFEECEEERGGNER